MGRSIDLEALYAGLVFSLPMFEGTGSATVQDVSKAHHPVSQVHAPAWTQLASGIYVMDFDGANDYLTATNAATADLGFLGTAVISGAIWIYTRSTAYQALIARGMENVDGWAMRIRPSTSFFQYFTGYPGYLYSESGALAMTTNTWLLISFSRTGTLTGSIYRDGRAATTSLTGGSSITASASNLTIGAWSDGTTQPFNGLMWNPRIWNRALAPAEHMELFNRERDLFHV